MTMEKQQWRKLDGTRIKRPIEDEIRAVLVREKEMGHELKYASAPTARSRVGKPNGPPSSYSSAKGGAASCTYTMS